MKKNICVSISKERYNQLISFCKKVKIEFKNIELLDQAFCHRSVINEKKSVKNNERLEFLGDSVLGMVTASYLYNSLENPEGDLAKIKSAVVSEKSLAPIALNLGVDKLLILGHGEELSGGRQKPAILADCMEAIIGAVYLDSGYQNAESFVLSFIENEIKKVLDFGMKDYKTVLQEKYQHLSKKIPIYKVISQSGPDHARIFEITVTLGNRTFGPAKGKNKKDAEQNVAKIALNELFG